MPALVVRDSGSAQPLFIIQYEGTEVPVGGFEAGESYCSNNGGTTATDPMTTTDTRFYAIPRPLGDVSFVMGVMLTWAQAYKDFEHNSKLR